MSQLFVFSYLLVILCARLGSTVRFFKTLSRSTCILSTSPPSSHLLDATFYLKITHIVVTLMKERKWWKITGVGITNFMVCIQPVCCLNTGRTSSKMFWWFSSLPTKLNQSTANETNTTNEIWFESWSQLPVIMHMKFWICSAYISTTELLSFIKVMGPLKPLVYVCIWLCGRSFLHEPSSGSQEHTDNLTEMRIHWYTHRQTK